MSSQVNSGAISTAPHRRLSTPSQRRRRRMRKRRFGSSPGSFGRTSPRSIPRWPIAWRPNWVFATPKSPPARLGSIDTFRFEERALLAHCGDLIAAKKFDQALAIISGREHSFWLDRDVGRKAQWEACRRMAELGRLCVTVRAAVSKAGGDANAWIDAYTSKDGWFRLDQAQRRLEAWVANLDDDPQERPLGCCSGRLRRCLPRNGRWLYEGHGARQLDGAQRPCTRRTSTAKSSRSSRSLWRTFSSMPCVSRWALSSPSGSQRPPKSLSGPPSARCRASRRLEWQRFSRGRPQASASSSRAARSVRASTPRFFPTLRLGRNSPPRACRTWLMSLSTSS